MSIAEIIKYEGENDTFIWKHPCVDFNTTTQLIVHESQEAIFFLNGKALDLFGPGRYTLETQNIPLLSEFANVATDGKTPFHCEIYFINKTEQMAIKWGTDSKVQYMEPVYNFPIEIGASGEMSISVLDSRKLLVKLLGTEKILQRQQLVSAFRAFLMTKIKSYISKTIRTNKINIFEIDEELEMFSENLKKKLEKDFNKYGLNLDDFFVTTIVKPNGESKYEKFKELHFQKSVDIAEAELKQKLSLIEQQTKLQQVIMESQGLARKRAAEGYTYQQEKSFKVAENIATNEAIGQLTNIGVGLGTMAGIGGFITNTFKESMTGINNTITTNTCSKCGEELLLGTAFCSNCGTKIATNSCFKCGFIFVKPSKFCPLCGEKQGVNNNEK